MRSYSSPAIEKISPEEREEEDLADDEGPTSYCSREAIEAISRFFRSNKCLVAAIVHLGITIIAMLHTNSRWRKGESYVFFLTLWCSWFIILMLCIIELLEYMSQSLMVSARIKTGILTACILVFCCAYAVLLLEVDVLQEGLEYCVGFLLCVPYLNYQAFLVDFPRSEMNIVHAFVCAGGFVVIGVTAHRDFYKSTFEVVMSIFCVVGQFGMSRMMAQNVHNVQELHREHKRLQNKENWLSTIHSNLVSAKSSVEEQAIKKDAQLSTLRLTFVRQGKKLQHYQSMMAVEQHSLVEQSMIMEVKDNLCSVDLQAVERCTIDFDDVFIQKRLGPYSSYELYETIFHGTPAVMKRVPNEKMSKERVQQTVREVLLYGSVCHPRIAQFLGVSWSPFICLLFEYMNRGSLSSQLSRRDIRLLWKPHKLSIINDIALGMAYLHSRSTPIIHNNLTSDNCLMNSQFNTKISNVFCGSILPKQTLKYGSHSAPEVWNSESLDSAIDVYSFGVLVIEIDLQVAVPLSKGQVAYEPCSECPPEVNSLLQRCIKQNKSERPTFVEISNVLGHLIQNWQLSS
jgi:serine/threonine protein kinase